MNSSSAMPGRKRTVVTFWPAGVVGLGPASAALAVAAPPPRGARAPAPPAPPAPPRRPRRPRRPRAPSPAGLRRAGRPWAGSAAPSSGTRSTPSWRCETARTEAVMPGPQLAVLVVDAQHGVVRDDVLRDRRLRANLEDRARERLARVRVDGERRLLALVQLADVGLVDGGVHLHARQVLRDREQHGRLQRRRDGLAHVDRALQHRARDGRADRRVLEVDARDAHRRARLPHLRVGRRAIGHRLVVLRPRGVEIGRADDLLSTSGLARSSSTFASRRLTSACTSAASADLSAASACARLALKRVGSICAMICPSLTWLLKSAPSFAIAPETCEPTCTVTTALSAPVAVTVASTDPRSTRAVRKVTGVVMLARRQARSAHDAAARRRRRGS